ncbi:MAG: hypothetical protein ACFFC6_12585 [Promethearchaeota archaeon]
MPNRLVPQICGLIGSWTIKFYKFEITSSLNEIIFWITIKARISTQSAAWYTAVIVIRIENSQG